MRALRVKAQKNTSWHALTISESLLNWLWSINTCITLAKAAKSAAANFLGTAGRKNRMRWKRARNSNCESFHLFSCHEVITRRAKRGRKGRKISQKSKEIKRSSTCGKNVLIKESAVITKQHASGYSLFYSSMTTAGFCSFQYQMAICPK